MNHTLMSSVPICVHPWLISALFRVFRVIRGSSLSSAHLPVLCGSHHWSRLCESVFTSRAGPSRWHLLTRTAALDVRSPPGWFSRHSVIPRLGRHNGSAGVHNVHKLHNDKSMKHKMAQRFKSKNRPRQDRKSVV